MDKMREDFEAAYSEAAQDGGWTPDYRLHKNGDYMQPAVYWAFWAWQASRATLVVELPVPENETEQDFLDYIKDALRVDGIRYKRLEIIKI